MHKNAVLNNQETVLIDKTEQFVKAWFNQSISGINPLLNDFFLLPEGKTMEKGQVETRIKKIFKQSTKHEGGRFEIIDVQNHVLADAKAMGSVEGVAGFRALNGQTSKIVSGPFKLFFAYNNNSYEIVHVVFPGFSY